MFINFYKFLALVVIGVLLFGDIENLLSKFKNLFKKGDQNKTISK